jgi:hypothetical protein
MDIRKRALEQWDRVAAIVLVMVGALALVLGYNGVSSTEFVAAQIPYFISGGLVGLFCLGAAGVLWLSSDLRDEWVKLDRLDSTLQKLEGLLDALPKAADADAATNGAPGRAPKPPARPKATTARRRAKTEV